MTIAIDLNSDNRELIQDQIVEIQQGVQKLNEAFLTPAANDEILATQEPQVIGEAAPPVIENSTPSVQTGAAVTEIMTATTPDGQEIDKEEFQAAAKDAMQSSNIQQDDGTKHTAQVSESKSTDGPSR